MLQSSYISFEPDIMSNGAFQLHTMSNETFQQRWWFTMSLKYTEILKERH